MSEEKTKYGLAAELINCVPTNWCDPILTGPDNVLPGGCVYKPDDIERLLNAIRTRMESVSVNTFDDKEWEYEKQKQS